MLGCLLKQSNTKWLMRMDRELNIYTYIYIQTYRYVRMNNIKKKQHTFMFYLIKYIYIIFYY